MSLFDFILIIIIAGFGLFGLWFGFIHTLGSLVGTLLGAFVASRYYGPAAEFLMNITGWGENASSVTMFIVIFLVTNRLVGFLFWIVERTIGVVAKLPFIKSLNRLLGMLLGVFEGLVTVGLIVYFIDIFPFSSWLTNSIEESIVVPYCLSVAMILLPLLPEGLKILKESAEQIEEVLL